MILVIAFYTDKKYERLAKRLQASARRLKVACHIERAKDLGSWQKNTLQKPRFIRRTMDQFEDVDEFLLVDADAVLKEKPISFPQQFAVYRFRPTQLHHSDAWHNMGILLNGTIYMRRGEFTDAVLTMWLRENLDHPDRLDQKNLAAVLARADASQLRCLPPEYCWVERFMRPLKKDATPVIVHEARAMGREDELRSESSRKVSFGSPPPVEDEVGSVEGAPESKHQLSWSGHLYDLSGYAKANREILFRVACTYQTKVVEDYTGKGRVLVDDYTRRRLEIFRDTKVSPTAPFLRFYIPVVEQPGRHRIVFTMMETAEQVHPDMAKTINRNYHELWTPTRWNAETFRKGGVRIPISVIPLGVDRHVYKPIGDAAMPKTTLLTTSSAGKVHKPGGFRFIYVCQPTFRKGIPFLVKAFTAAFPKGGEPELILATTANEGQFAGCDPFREAGASVPETIKARIYHLGGCYSEVQMASIFRACQVYVTTSLGEGWNLPLTEAAACGLPVIAPHHSSHKDILSDQNSFLFSPDGYRKHPEGDPLCKWYVGQLFANYGKGAFDQLVERLRFTFDHFKHSVTRRRAMLLSSEIRATYSWDNSADAVLNRLGRLK